MAKELQIRCKSDGVADFGKLQPFQGGLKTIAPAEIAKLKNEMLEVGLCKAFTVWPKGDGNLYILDGHQRWKVLAEMVRTDEIQIPKGGVPCEPVDCVDEAEATRIVLALASQHGRLNKKNLSKLVARAGMTDEEAQQTFSFVEMDKPSQENPTGPETKGWKGAKVVECPNCNTYSYFKDHKCDKEIPKADIWDEQKHEGEGGGDA